MVLHGVCLSFEICPSVEGGGVCELLGGGVPPGH